jgi:hypothetical protein
MKAEALSDKCSRNGDYISFWQFDTEVTIRSQVTHTQLRQWNLYFTVLVVIRTIIPSSRCHGFCRCCHLYSDVQGFWSSHIHYRSISPLLLLTYAMPSFWQLKIAVINTTFLAPSLQTRSKLKGNNLLSERLSIVYKVFNVSFKASDLPLLIPMNLEL